MGVGFLAGAGGGGAEGWGEEGDLSGEGCEEDGGEEREDEGGVVIC